MSKNKKEYTKKKMIRDIIIAVISIILLFTAHIWFDDFMIFILSNFTKEEQNIIIDNNMQIDIIEEKEKEYNNTNHIKDSSQFYSIENEYIIINNKNIRYRQPASINYTIIEADKTIIYTLDDEVILIVDTLGTNKYIDSNNERLEVQEINGTKFIYNDLSIYTNNDNSNNNYNKHLQTINEILNSIEVIE